MPNFFNQVMVRDEQDILNWILDESGCLTLKSARTFFLEPRVPYCQGKFIWSSFIVPFKTLVLWKVFHVRLPTDQHIHNKCLHEESSQHLCFECSNALHIWS